MVECWIEKRRLGEIEGEPELRRHSVYEESFVLLDQCLVEGVFSLSSRGVFVQSTALFIMLRTYIVYYSLLPDRLQR